jgi:hypothetical protein
MNVTNLHTMKLKTQIPQLLKFSHGNGKLPAWITIFSLPAGYTCPAADICKAKAVQKEDGKWGVEDGPNMTVRCYAASDETRYKDARNARWHNFNLLKSLNKDEMVNLIKRSLPPSILVRIHESGDFFNQAYFDAWMQVAIDRSDVQFYAYTKSINYWINRAELIPDNFTLTASVGGKWDELIAKHDLNTVEIVLNEDEATAKGLELDEDDSHAYNGSKRFALSIHNIQPKGTVQMRESRKNAEKKRKKKQMI